MSELTVIIPCYRDENVLHETHRRLTDTLTQIGLDYDILYVNDGSPDETWRIICEISDKDERVRGINLSRNYGHQIAVTAGMDATDSGAAIVMDSDLQDPPEVLPEMVSKWKQGYDIVSAVRSGRSGDSFIKQRVAEIFYWLLSKVTPTPIPQQAGDFRLISKNVLAAMKQIRERHRFLRGLTIWTGFKQTTIPYERTTSHRDTTGYTAGKMFGLAFDALVSFSVIPLRMASFLGILLFGISTIAAVIIIGMKLTVGILVEGWTTLFVAVMFLSGIQLLVLGIAGEYIGRIYEEVKSRPLYFVAETRGGNT